MPHHCSTWQPSEFGGGDSDFAVVWRVHGLPHPELEERLLERLGETASTRYGVEGFWIDGHRRRIPDAGWWPYRSAEADGPTAGEPLELTAIPYYAWANREDGSMRVWLPTS